MQGWNESAARAEVTRFVEKYARAEAEGRLSRYGDNRFGEESTKRGFISPPFRALSWRDEDSRAVLAEERDMRGPAGCRSKIGELHVSCSFGSAE